MISGAAGKTGRLAVDVAVVEVPSAVALRFLTTTPNAPVGRFVVGEPAAVFSFRYQVTPPPPEDEGVPSTHSSGPSDHTTVCPVAVPTSS
jgi:hypothetical protein